MSNDKTATTNPDDNGMSRYYGRPFLIPVEVLPETAQRDPAFIIHGQFVEIEGEKFYRVSRWHKK